uniref:Uncharacterized protein n=1 Tax=Oryza glaberrima TaxID=4538 RepID=I1R703_ORYGL
MASTQRDTRPRSSARGRRPSHDQRARMASLGFLRTVWDMNLSAWENGDEVVVGVVIGHAEALGGAAERRSGDRREVKLDAVAELGRQLLERLHAARGSLGGGCGARRSPRRAHLWPRLLVSSSPRTSSTAVCAPSQPRVA